MKRAQKRLFFFSTLSPMQKLDQLRAIHQQTDPQVQSILTPQYTQWEEMRWQEVMNLLQQRRAAQVPQQ